MTAQSTCLRLRRWFSLGLGIFLILPYALALDPSRSVFEYNIQTWNRQNGLPFNRISAITQTSDGYLWMGTQNGLVRFDAVDFAHFTIPNRAGWHSKSVNCLRASPRGGFWFGLDAGAFGYFDGTNRFDALTGDWVLPQMNVHAVQEDPDGSLWIGSRGGLAALLGGKTNQPLLNADIGEINAVCEDPQHRVWLGTVEKGLYYWEDGKLNQFPDRDLIGITIRAIAMDREGRLWVGTSYGLRCYDRSLKRNDPLTLYTEVQALLPDTHGAMWIGTSGGGLLRQYNGQTSYLRKTNGLAEDYVSSLCEDREGSLWVGTRDGLTQISDLKFPAASTLDGLLSEPVHGVCASSNGSIWCATSAGIYNYNDKDKSIFYLALGTNANPYVKRVLEARNGDLYAFTGNREVEIFASNQIVAHYTNSDWPVAMTEDTHGMVVAAGSQLFRVNRHEFVPFVFENTPPNFYWIRNLCTSADGSLLLATVNGLFRISDDQIEHWTTAEGLADQDVICVNEDDEGTIWLGQTTGLTRIKNHKASIIHLAGADGLINAIIPDDLGNLWLSSSTGVIRAKRRDLNDFADGKIPSLNFKLYDGVDALRTIDLTEAESVACKTANGKIWLPGPLGVLQIDPANITTNPLPPPVCIQKVLVNGILQTNSSIAEIRHGKGELAFQYTALSFIAPQKTHFRYKLEGYDSDWIDAGSQRSALYANLPPGKYHFRLEACNVDGVWNTAGASVVVELPPTFYQTVWFKIAIGIFILVLLSGLYGWRTRHLREKEKTLQAANEQLENKIRERTTQLAEQRNLLRTLIDNLPDAVFVKDNEGRVIIDNLAHARYLGFESPADSIGKSDFDCLSPEKAEQFRAAEIDLIKSGKEFNGEENLTLKSGDTRWFRTTKVPLRDEHGKIIGLAGINRDITERKKWESELQLLHKQLLETSRHAGMAEVATSVLHNVGNVLNSVNISASLVGEQVRDSNLERLGKVVQLLQENQSNLGQFLTQDEKGAKLISYLAALFDILKKESATVQNEVEALTKNIEHIKKIVAMQQSYARVAGVIETVQPAELIEDSMRMHEAAFQRHCIRVVRDYSDAPKLQVDRHKVIQILVNLLGNAKYACDTNPPANRIIRVRVNSPTAERIRIEIADNGVGIPQENLTRIFSYGFTTRKNGHGFGLHGGALAAKEMGGSLQAHSEGPGKGATFILELPVSQ